LKTSPEFEGQTVKDSMFSSAVSPSAIKCNVMVAVGNGVNDLHIEIRRRSFGLVERLPKGLLKV